MNKNEIYIWAFWLIICVGIIYSEYNKYITLACLIIGIFCITMFVKTLNDDKNAKNNTTK